MRSSLRGKLILSHLAVIFVAMSVVTLLLLTLGRDYFLNALEESLVAQAHLISQALIPGASAALPEESLAPAINTLQQQQIGNLSIQVENKEPAAESELQPELSASNLSYLTAVSVELSTSIETRFLVLDNQGIVLMDSLELDEGTNLRSEGSVMAAFQGAQQSNTQSSKGEEWLFVTVPIWMDDQIVSVIHVGQPLRDVTAVLNDLRTRLILVLVIALPLSAIIGLLLANSIANPLRVLTVAAGRLGLGDYEYPLDTSAKDELGQLSKTFSEMRERLQLEERTRTQFVSDVSHELRTPLTAIKGLTETLRDGAVDDPQVRDRFLASVEEETDRLIRLVNDLLILSRADSNALSLRLEDVDLRDLAKNTIDRFATQFEARNVTVVTDFPDTPLMVNVDADKIEQVIVNLLDNALKHSPLGEQVIVSGQVQSADLRDEKALRPNEDQALPDHTLTECVVLRVIDAGEGIDPGDIPYVFDRFFRADQSRSRDQGGSGLGLSIAKAIVEAHGGIIWLESPPSIKGVSRGSSANVALPCELFSP
jgi:signal transduction histidine kinase